jgi:hypothetical protein
MPKRKLTPEEKAEKKRRNLEYETVFRNGKQVRVKKMPTIDGLPVDDWLTQNADPILLHQSERWDLMEIEAE